MRPERKPNIILLGSLVVILLFFVIFEPSYGWKIRAFFTPSGGGASGNAVAGSASAAGGADQGAMNGLIAENDALKAQLAELQGIAAELPTSTSGYLRAMVYSRYPLNFKNELFVDAGTDDGVATGSAVVYQGLLIGRVITAWPSYAAVQTVFDNDFRLPVRVGSGGYDGLLTGGSYPFVASIAKNSPVTAGDIVVSAASGVPYALPVGEVQTTSTSPDNLFTQATLAFPYDINQVETVLIAKP